MWLLRTEDTGDIYGFSGGACNPFTNSTCAGDAWCALENVDYMANATLFEGYICCHSGEAAPFESTRYQDAGYSEEHDFWGNWVCDHSSPKGKECIAGVCEEDTQCRDGVCVATNDAKSLYGDPCDRDHSHCASGFCLNGICAIEPRICPDPALTFLAGFRLDPFCRTLTTWCEYTDLALLKNSLEAAFLALDVDLGLGENGTLCVDILKLLSIPEFSLVKIINETDADIGYSQIFPNYSHVEEVVVEDWTYFVLISIAVMGFFALASILRKVVLPQTDERPKEYKTKVAGASKVSNMIENAMMLHSRNNGKGRVMVSSSNWVQHCRLVCFCPNKITSLS